MLDLLTAGTLAFLPLSLQSALVARVRQAMPPDREAATTSGTMTAAPITIDQLRHHLRDLLNDEMRATALVATAQAAADRAVTRAARAGIQPIPWRSADYPTLLDRLADPPPLLWTRGNPALLSLPTVAIVGSRAASAYGLEVAFRLAADLAAHGVIVVSGLARGVDSASHRGALSRGAATSPGSVPSPDSTPSCGSTIAVLGCGADVVYPREHAGLAADIARRGLIVSELPPGTPPRAWHFPRRNRLISGLSLAVVVVEASTRSGSLQTARLALEQGREVMAVPGTILGERNRGSHGLLRDGAVLVEQASDILDELHLPRLPFDADPSSVDREDGDDTTSAGPTSARAVLLSVMRSGEVHEFQELIAMTRLSAGDVLRELLRAEVRGAIVRTAGSRFLRVGRPVVR